MTIEAVEIRTGDVLVISCPMPLPSGGTDTIREAVEAKFPGHTVLVLASGLSLQVVRSAA